MKNDHPDILPQLLSGEQPPGQALGLDATQLAALMQTGHTLFSEGRRGMARDIFAGLAVLDPGNPYVQGMLGAIYQQEGNLEAAVTHYSRCLELGPDNPQTWLNRGESFLRLGFLDRAVADFAEAIARDTSTGMPAGNRARVLLALVQDTVRSASEKGIDGVAEVQRALQARIDQIANDAG